MMNMKKYIPILLILSAVLIVLGDQLQFGLLKHEDHGSHDNASKTAPSPAEDHDHSEHSDDDHSDPENIKRMAIFHFNEGNKSLRQEKWEEAEKNYKKALIHNKEMEETYINLSTTYFRAKKFDEALNTLRDLEKINASNPLLHYNLACYYSLTNQPDASLAAVKNAVNLGYKNFKEIQTDPDLENLRKAADFKAWLQSLRNEPQKS
jgi:tetratricopeptide (TPR) repeat protein